MDPLSSADLDSSSKTPLYIGIAAVILALVALGLGWMSFSKNKELEAQIAELIASQSDSSAIEEKVDTQLGATKKEMTDAINNMAKQVSAEINKMSDDVSSNKRSLRTVTIQAGTALKKVEALEKNGIKVTTTTKKPTTTTTTSSSSKSSGSKSVPSSTTKPSTSGSTKATTYAVQGGDTLSGIAGKFKISLNALLGANPGVDPYSLQIGQKLTIPGAK